MKTIIVKTQKEWDSLPISFKELTYVYIQSDPNISIVIARKIESAHVVARGSAHVVAWESAHVEAWESAHVEARGSAHVVAWESAHVVAWERAHVEARGSAHVVAWESAHVVAWERAHVEAYHEVLVHNQSVNTTIELFGFAVVMAIQISKLILRNKTAKIIKVPERKYTVKEWMEREGVRTKNKKAIIYKRVSSDFKTQEKTANETVWVVGSTIVHANYDPTTQECNTGKFHACSRPYFCDEFRSTAGDKYIAIEVSLKDMHAWPNPTYPHKIAFKGGKVLFECDRYGDKQIKTKHENRR